MSSYIIISPVRNEENFIEETIKSVLDQTVRPVEYILVNDGSTDRTEDIINKYVKKYNWIKTIKRPPANHNPGAGVVKAFYEGFNNLSYNNWEFIVKLDGDLKFDKNYFESLLDRFKYNPKLGMASGKTFQYRRNRLVIDKMPDDHVRGAAKMYRRECWEGIGGLQKVLGWDTIDELKAQVLGWETKSFRDLVLVHFKPIGHKQKNIMKREIKAGERQHYLGYLPVFAIIRGLYRMFQKPFFVAGLLNIIGFLHAYINNKSQLEDRSLILYLRFKQKQRLTFKRKLIN